MELAAGFWAAVAVGLVSLLWWWNDCRYALPLRLRGGGGAKLPPGYMGLPLFGDILAFLWYLKVLGRPDDYINAKRRRYDESMININNFFAVFDDCRTKLELLFCNV